MANPQSSSSSSRGWLTNLSTYASRVYFLLIILQIPIFRIPCRAGTCTTPLHVTSSQLIASEIFPVAAVKVLLYPGAIANGIVTNMTIPSWNDLLDIYNLTDVKGAASTTDLQRLEVLAGSYFSVAGALIGVLKAGRMSMFGTLLIVWGLVKEGILGKNADASQTIMVYPTIVIALICAFSSVKYDLNKLTTITPARPIAKPMKSSTKSKLR